MKVYMRVYETPESVLLTVCCLTSEKLNSLYLSLFSYKMGIIIPVS